MYIIYFASPLQFVSNSYKVDVTFVRVSGTLTSKVVEGISSSAILSVATKVAIVIESINFGLKSQLNLTDSQKIYQLVNEGFDMTR